MPVYRKLSDIPTPAEYAALVKAFFQAERKRELISVPARFERPLLNSMLWSERLKRNAKKILNGL